MNPARPDAVLRFKLQQLLDSYEHWIGVPLTDVDGLFEAPFAVLAHGTELPPILWYGNRQALALWKMSFADFTRMPSYETAEPDAREVRETLLREVRAQGYSTHYSGVRVASDGTRFLIEQVTVWNVLDAEGRTVGQAAAFPSARTL